MFKKVKKKEKIIKPSELHGEIEVKDEIINSEKNKEIDDNDKKVDIVQIRNKIDEKQKKVSNGITIKPIISEIPKKEEYEIPIEEQTENNIKKIFIPETKIKEQTNNFLGIKREKEEKMKEQGRLGLLKMQKEIYTLPEHLKPQIITQDDYVENLIKLSTAGIIDVPIPLENKMKNEEIKIIPKNDFLLKSDSLKSSQPINNTINEKFGNVFLNQRGRKMKFIKEREKIENQKIEKL